MSEISNAIIDSAAEKALAAATTTAEKAGAPLPQTSTAAVEVDELGNDIVRYVTPVLVGWFITLAAKKGFHISTATAYPKKGFHISTATAYQQVFPFVSSGYFIAVRYLEQHIPSIGRLLGIKKPIKK